MIKANKRVDIRVSSGRQRARDARGATPRGHSRPKSHPSRRLKKLKERGLQIRAGHGDMSPQDIAERRRSEAQYIAAVKEFNAAVRFFQKQKYDKAKEIFERLSGGSVREVAARARVYLQLCDRKLNSTGRAPAAKSAEEYYNLGIVDLNARALDSALAHLSKADKLAPNQEHIRYALAAAHALQGNTDAALEHLRAAITLRHQNRVRARRDEDFRSLVADPRFRKL